MPSSHCSCSSCLGSLTIAGSVGYCLLGDDKAKSELDGLKGWLAVHNAAVMTVFSTSSAWT